MTKFLKSVEARTINYKKVGNLGSNFDVNYDITQYSSVQLLTEVRFSLTFNSVAYLPDDSILGERIEFARKDILRNAQREVYGEVEEKLFDLMEHMYHTGDIEGLGKVQDLLRLVGEV